MLVLFGDIVINMQNVVNFYLDQKKTRVVFSLNKSESDDIPLSFFSDEEAVTAFRRVLKAYKEGEKLVVLKQ